MVNSENNSAKLKAIVDILPKKNCGKCGYENCGKFALAVVNREASPFGCHQDSSTGYSISQVLGIPVPESVPVQSNITHTDSPHGIHTHGKHHHHAGHHAHRHG